MMYAMSTMSQHVHNAARTTDLYVKASLEMMWSETHAWNRTPVERCARVTVSAVKVIEIRMSTTRIQRHFLSSRRCWCSASPRMIVNTVIVRLISRVRSGEDLEIVYV